MLWLRACSFSLPFPPLQSKARIIYAVSNLKSGASHFARLSNGLEEGRALDWMDGVSHQWFLR